MRTLNGEHYQQALYLEYLNMKGDAKPVGKADANNPMVMVRSNPRNHVVYLGPVPKENIQVWK